MLDLNFLVVSWSLGQVPGPKNVGLPIKIAWARQPYF